MPLNTHIFELRDSPFGVNSNLLSILNKGTGTLKIFKVAMLNSSTMAGAVCAGELRRYTGAGLTGYSPALDTANPDYVTTPEIIFARGGTPSGSYVILKRYAWSSDAPAVGGATIDEIETLLSRRTLWDTGRRASFAQPLTLRTDQMFSLRNTAGSLAWTTILIELTKEGGGLPGGGGTLNEVKTANEYPMGYVKQGKASELRSKVVPA